MKQLIANLRSVSLPYLLWIATILVVGYLSIQTLPFTPSFPYYGDLSSHYSRAVAAFSHFDGIHYLRLVHKGYDDTGSQAFFPLYPLIVRLLSFNYFDPLYVAMILNALLTLATLIILVRGLSHTLRTRSLIFFLTFPTSFFLLSNYTESLFIFLVALFFHMLSHKKLFLAALVAGLASGTRFVGIFLALGLLVELARTRTPWLTSLSLLLLSVSGLISYLVFQDLTYGDPLMFVHVQSMFGGGRSSGEIVLLPQLMYRYFKILTTSPLSSLIGLRALWELLTMVVAGLALYLSRKKLSPPALAFCLGVLIFPTLSGTLSSFPRYALVALPLFVSLARSLSSRALALVSLVQYGILILAIALFVQGIFIA